MKPAPTTSAKDWLRKIPSVDKVVGHPVFADLQSVCSPKRLTNVLRDLFEEVRNNLLQGKLPDWDLESMESVRTKVMERIGREETLSLRRVVNCTGIVVHTNLGRSILADSAVEAIRMAALSAVNLEFETGRGERGNRDDLIEPILSRLTGAESATAVNNNAGALVILLNTLCAGKEAIVSRGEFIEIGGSFRLPEIMEKSGCRIVSVGTTNRTRIKDYEAAVTPDTGLILKVHTSNYRIVGFTEETSLRQLTELGRRRGIPVAEDLGSGALVDLSRYGLPKEPVVSESVSAGADLVSFSGDKLLGGPQAGLIVGKKEWVDRIRKNPLKRILRLDKLILAGLEATLKLYLDPDRLPERLPLFRFLLRPLAEMERTAETLARLLAGRFGQEAEIRVERGFSQVGGGALPEENLESRVVTIRHKRLSPDDLAERFRRNDPPIVGRIQDDLFRLDVRCLDRAEDAVPGGAF